MATPVKPETFAEKRIRLEAEARSLDRDYIGKQPHLVRDPIQPASFTPATNVEEYSFAWWFNYFWAEGRRGGKPDATADERDAFWWVVAQMFEATSLPKNNGEASRINEGGTGLKLKGSVGAMDPAKQRKVLHVLMQIGFEEFPVAFRQTAESLFAHLVNVPSRDGANDHVTFSLALGYRSDSRPWSAIQSQGIRARSHVPVLVQSMRMSEPWHPFSQADVANKLWFRKGIEDNCLHSVISIASTFNDALYFPRIDDGSIYPFIGKLAGPKPLNERWTPDVNMAAKKARASICKAALGNGDTRYFFGSRTTILVFAFPPSFTAANTEAYQRSLGGASPFPERGVGEVPPEYVLAILDVVRVHHGLTADDGQTNFVMGITEVRRDDAELKSVLLTDDAVLAYKAYIGGHRAKIGQPQEYPKDRKGYKIVRLLSDDAYGPAFRQGMGGLV